MVEDKPGDTDCDILDIQPVGSLSR